MSLFIEVFSNLIFYQHSSKLSWNFSAQHLHNIMQRRLVNTWLTRRLDMSTDNVPRWAASTSRGQNTATNTTNHSWTCKIHMAKITLTLEIQHGRNTRGHPYWLFVNFAKNNVRKNFFAHWVVRYWNFLSADVVDFSSLCHFQQIITRVDFSKFLVID